MRVSAGLLVLLALVHPATPADACTIVLPTVVFPALSAAPRNTHVWILDGDASERFALRLASQDGAGANVDIAAYTLGHDTVAIELVPRKLLAPHQRYELWSVSAPPAWAPGSNVEHVVGSFTTDDALDEAPPPPPAVESTRLTLRPIPLCGVATVVGPMRAPTPDDEPTLLALWYESAAGDDRVVRSPDRLVAGPTPGRRVLSYIEGLNLKKRAPRIVVRAVDLAGNLSAPVVLSL